MAKLTIAHKLALRIYWMLRGGADYAQLVPNEDFLTPDEWQKRAT